MRAFEAALSTPWAMLPERIEEVLAIAAREHELTPEALEAYKAQGLARAEEATRRGPVAILQVRGPLFRYANLFTAFSGATSYDVLRADFQAAVDDPTIRAILLNVNSPGGAVDGVDELAKAIFSAREKKPVVAYIGGTGASAGYWIGTAASEVVVSDAAIVGSIGVYMAIQDTKTRDASRGVRTIEFVSSQSPDKRSNPETDEGRARIQRTVDDLADVFVSAVAKHRGMSVERVLAEFSRGGVEVGAKAVALGMADRVGDFEGVLQDLSSRGGQTRPLRSGAVMTTTPSAPAATDAGIPKADHDAAVAKAKSDGKAEGITEYKARRQAVLALDEAKGRETLAETLADTPLSVEQIKASLAAAPKGDAKAEPKPAAETPEAYAAQRAAAGLAAPGGAVKPPAADAKAGWGKAAARINNRL